MGDAYWEETQRILQGDQQLVIKPKLNENLLKKPPFRFLHDVISQVITNTGFAAGLYEGDELTAANIKDKDAKIAYLTKMVNAVGIASGASVPIKPQKVVAGLEPENTNTFLQMLGRIATQTDGADAVKRVLAGESQPEGDGAPPPAPKPKAAEPEVDVQPPSSIGMSQPTEDEPTAPAAAPERKSKSRSSAAEEEKPKEEKPKGRSRRSESEKPKPEPEPEPERQEIGRATGRGIPERPQSARRGPPKIVKKEDAKLTGGMAPPGSGKPPPAPSQPARGIMSEGDGGMDDDDDDDEGPLVVNKGDSNFSAKGNEGKLVRDILDTKDELSKGQEDKEEKADSKETGILLGRGRKKKEEGYKKEEITQLREAIQMLCQTTNPLAKCMDQLQEDMENMHKELNFWNTEKKTFASKHREEERATIDELNQMGSLQELDDEINSAREKTNSIKAQILRNDETIERLLSLVVTGSGK